jgi:NAD(P)-dependent dehydrogenase (short-subunit alcohol dehydrogenase family)
VTRTGGLDGRVAVVTGSRRGIGFAIATALAREGAAVMVCTGSQPQAAAEAADRIRQAHGTATASFAGDLAADGTAATLVDAAERELGPVDILVNNAGGFVDPLTTLQTERADWEDMLAANLTAPFLLTRAVLPGMLARGFGRIINIGSEVALSPMLGNAVAYSAAKAGLIGFTKHVALEAAGTGITANVINPGTIGTEHLDDVFTGSEVEADALARSIPLGRFGTPEEVAGVVPFLASDLGAYTTGAVFGIDGGRTMH